MEQRIAQIWYGGRPAPVALRPLSWLYSQAVRWRRSAYTAGWLAARRAGKPVIIVGNLTVGGTGKTPLVEWLATHLSAAGLRVGIVSRGHGRTARAVQFVHEDTPWREVGDEPWLLHHRTGCDTVVARDRLAGSTQLVSRGADVVIADDGLQHLRLARDCEVVVIDGARGFGNGQLLPAGPLREAPGRALEADVIVVNGPAEHPSLIGADRLPCTALQMDLRGNEAHRLDGRGASQPLERFAGHRVHAVAGIGNPQRFFRSLRAQQIDLIEHAFPDHHPFTARDLSFPDDLAVLMTEKDAVRCRELANGRAVANGRNPGGGRAPADGRLWYVPVAASFAEGQGRELLDRVMRKLDSSAISRG